MMATSVRLMPTLEWLPVLLHVKPAMVAVGLSSSAAYNSTTIVGVTLHLADTLSAPMPLMVSIIRNGVISQ